MDADLSVCVVLFFCTYTVIFVDFVHYMCSKIHIITAIDTEFRIHNIPDER